MQRTLPKCNALRTHAAWQSVTACPRQRAYPIGLRVAGHLGQLLGLLVSQGFQARGHTLYAQYDMHRQCAACVS